MYTTQPSTYWPGYIDILQENGFVVQSVPAGRERAAIAEREESDRQHWLAIAARTDDRLVVANGHAYHIGSSGDCPKGFGGQRWRIAFFDGREIEIDSLWHLGDIPHERRASIADNATLKGL
jgi:hypothetical protein